MKKMAYLVGLLIFATSSSPLIAKEMIFDERFKLATANTVDELIECGIFFQYTSAGFEGLSDEKSLSSQRKYEQLSDAAFTVAIQLAASIGISQEAIVAKTELFANSQRELIGGEMINFSVLMVKYLNPCIELMKDPSVSLKDNMKEQGLDPGK